MDTPRLVVAAIAFAATSCGLGRSGTVREGDFARLDPAQTVQVESSRGALAQAREELARARAKVPEGRREGELAEADRKVAEATLEKARKELETAETLRRAADARRDYAEKLTEVLEADEEVAERRIDLANARIELAKLQALEQAGAPGVAQYEQSAFYERITDAQRDLEAAQGEARKLDEQAKAAHRRWEDLVRKVQAARP